MADEPSELLIERYATHEVIYEIGVLIASAAQFEYDISVQIARLSSRGPVLDYTATALTVGMDFKVKLALIRSMAAWRKYSTKERIFKACDKLQEFWQRRNDMAHTGIVGRHGPKTVFQSFRIEPKTGSIPSRLRVSAEEIRRWSAGLEHWAIELDAAITAGGGPVALPTLKAPRTKSAKPPRSRNARTNPDTPPTETA
jgi:hypothetical protein